MPDDKRAYFIAGQFTQAEATQFLRDMLSKNVKAKGCLTVDNGFLTKAGLEELDFWHSQLISQFGAMTLHSHYDIDHNQTTYMWGYERYQEAVKDLPDRVHF